MKKKETELSGIEFTIRRKNMKNMRIRVSGDKRVCVSAPHHLPENRIIAFVAQNERFIKERLHAVEQKRRRCYPASYASGDSLMILGRRMTLRVVRDKKAWAGIDGGELVLCVPPETNVKTAFARFMTRTAKDVFLTRLAAMQKVFHSNAAISLSVRNMLTRWGSINTKRLNLSLSVHLLRCETELIDYVIMHELCHLDSPNHSSAFYKALESYFPQRKICDKRLNEYGLVDF